MLQFKHEYKDEDSLKFLKNGYCILTEMIRFETLEFGVRIGLISTTIRLAMA